MEGIMSIPDLVGFHMRGGDSSGEGTDQEGRQEGLLI